MDKPLLFRKRYIPDETVCLKDDEIIMRTEDVITTRWTVLKPRTDFVRGCSCYFLKKGFKVSQFIDQNGLCVYTYCDIIESIYDPERNAYIFHDLLIDVVVYGDGTVRVLDIAEIADALEQNLISQRQAEKALRLTDELLTLIYGGRLHELLAYLNEG